MTITFFSTFGFTFLKLVEFILWIFIPLFLFSFGLSLLWFGVYQADRDDSNKANYGIIKAFRFLSLLIGSIIVSNILPEILVILLLFFV